MSGPREEAPVWFLVMELSVREAGSADAAAILEIYVTSWNEGFGSRMPVIAASDDRLHRWRADLSVQTPTQWWLAQRGGVILGFVGIGPGRDPELAGWGELDTIAVLPNAWGTGVGSVLMQHAVSGLVESGYACAYLWTLSDYPLGERFYRTRGWQNSEVTRMNGDQVRYEIDL